MTTEEFEKLNEGDIFQYTRCHLVYRVEDDTEGRDVYAYTFDLEDRFYRNHIHIHREDWVRDVAEVLKGDRKKLALAACQRSVQVMHERLSRIEQAICFALNREVTE